MAIEALNIQPSATPLNNANNNKVGQYSIQDQLLGTAKNKNNSTPENISDKDKVSLSADAQNIVNGNLPALDTDAIDVNSDSLANQSLQFRGFSQKARVFSLTENEVARVNEIRGNFANAGITSDRDILKTADKTLSVLQGKSADLIKQFQNGDITGKEFGKLTQINKLLNKSNGFGVEQLDSFSKSQADTIDKQISAITEQAGNQKLSQNSLAALDNLQQRLNKLHGFELNVQDSIGPDGVIV